MYNQRAIQIAELSSRLMQLDATTLSEQQLEQRNNMIFKLKEEIKMLDEASLATMRDYFAGDENARDPMKITQQRLHFAKDKNAKPTVDKRFRSPEEYQQWLKQNKLKQISTAESAEQEIEEEKQRLDPKCWDGYKKQGTKIKGGVRVNNCVPESVDQGMAEGSLNEFAPDGFNGGDDGEEFSPEIAKMAQEDGFTKGAGLADGATLERAMAINYWHSTHGGMYKQYFVKGFKAGRMDKIRHNNKQYNLDLQLMKDGSIRHGEQGVAEAKKPSPKLTPVEMKKTDPVSEEINTEAYERLQKVFAFKNYES